MGQRKFAWANAPEAIGEDKITSEYQADLVIVGAGHAGTCAARAAAETGKRVIVLEQQSEEKQWILGVGEIGHINSKWQEKHGLREEKSAGISGGIYHELQVRMTFHSNHMEGSKLTEDQTRMIFETNTIDIGDGIPIDDILETIHHFRAIDYCMFR